MSDVNRYEPFGRDGLSNVMHEDALGSYVFYDHYEAKRKGWAEQHARDSKELSELCQARDDARKERDQLRAELAAIRGQEPVAFAVFADNGNIRIWSANSSAIRAELIAQDLTITDLYALPPQQPDAVSVPRKELEALRQDAKRFRFVVDCPIITMVALGRMANQDPNFDLAKECDAILSTRQAEEGE